MKILKILLISLSLATILSSCNLPGRSGLPTQITNQNLVGTSVAMTMQANPTQTKIIAVTPLSTTTMATASPIPTPIPPNTPVWLAYNYTCKFVVGGGDMTMNLAWRDRSNSEEGYKVYRGEQVIAILAPNSTFYVDVAFVATGKTLNYSVEAFTENWQVSSSVITYGCQ
ncbi:MAG: hypothetical protein Q7T89_09995 [Anaerolineales bacterium]|nr:hypothetical protein [Anaerolineales bacterium]